MTRGGLYVTATAQAALRRLAMGSVDRRFPKANKKMTLIIEGENNAGVKANSGSLL
jgi:hypothetical protein